MSHFSISHQCAATLLAALTLTFASALQAQTVSTGVRAGTLKTVKGEVFIQSGESRRAAQSGDALAESDRLETGSAGAASMVLRDGTVVSMGGNSNMALTRARYDATTQLGELFFGLLRGSMRVVSGLIAKTNPRSLVIHTPTSTLGVRGTDFIVEVGPENFR